MPKIKNCFKKEGELQGTVEIDVVPPFLGYHINLYLFKVKSQNSQWPFIDYYAPKESPRIDIEIAHKSDFNQEDTTGTISVDFCLFCTVGWYYIQLNFILYRRHNDKMYAQVENFPFHKRPVVISSEAMSIVLPISWPQIPVEDLGVYGRMKPGGKGRLY